MPVFIHLDMSALAQIFHGKMCIRDRRLTNREIADRLHLAQGTIKNQLSRIFEKLEISPDSKNKRLELEKRFRTEK